MRIATWNVNSLKARAEVTSRSRASKVKEVKRPSGEVEAMRLPLSS